MTPKEKAKELVNTHYSLISGISLNYISKLLVLPSGDSYYETAKKCAIFSVDQLIIQNGELYLVQLDGTYYREKNNFLFKVKSEIEKL
jgi:hypothetical protein